MRGGNKMQNFTGSRNLKKSQLGGVIFGCTSSTIKECLFKQLFGLPAQHFSYVKNIDVGLPLFLFNYSDRKLHGIFEAASSGQMNIDPYGWTIDGSERTQYPAQVQIHVRLQCQPLHEQQFKPVITHNYYNHNHFWFELDHGQANKLMSLLASSAIAPSTSLHQNTATWRTIFQAPHSTRKEEEAEGFKTLALEVKHSNRSSGKLDSRSNGFHFDGIREGDEVFLQPDLDVEHCNQSNGKSQSADFHPFDPLETHLDARRRIQDEEVLILMKLKELASQGECHDLSSTNNVETSTLKNNKDFNDESFLKEQTDSEQTNNGSCCSNCQSVIAQLIQGMEELKIFKAEQSAKMNYMEQKLVKVEKEIEELKDRCTTLESMSNHSVEPVNEMTIESSDELDLDPTTSIFLLGGYDGESCLSTLDSYFPSQDVIKSLKPMNSVRSYASVVQLNGEIFIFGGGNGSEWYDTVESYSSANDQWTLCPSLTEKKGSLAGATLDGKIFAMGGGNGFTCFSDVEMLDLDVGRWIRTRSMTQKRFALAAVELNGAIYATGGFDGNDYLTSAERFDPREYSWSKIASMSTRRGCHSLVVLNEKLYALGGFDGIAMVPSIEIYDPRLESWIASYPMNQPRGYSAAAVVEGSIHVIGGVKDDQDIVGTVECYKEGRGWQEKSSRAIGKRCFMSAITLSQQNQSTVKVARHNDS
ncbi:hypothetical protein SLA2020_385090 [Shorea laevis]